MSWKLSDRQEFRAALPRYPSTQRLPRHSVVGAVPGDQNPQRHPSFARLDAAADEEFDVLEVVQPCDSGEDEQLGLLDERSQPVVPERLRCRGRRYRRPYRADPSLVDAPADQILPLQA